MDPEGQYRRFYIHPKGIYPEIAHPGLSNLTLMGICLCKTLEYFYLKILQDILKDGYQ
jgi:hypothetical protein